MTDTTASAEKPITATKAAPRTDDTDAEVKGYRPGMVITKAAEKKLWSFLGIALFFTLILNIIMLVAPMYMLQVYDRVLTSSSVETLIVLTVIAVFLLLIYIAADAGRKRVFAMAGKSVGEELDAATLRTGLDDAKSPPAAILENMGNLVRVQGFLVNGTAAPLLDALFVPLFLGILFFVHPILGAVGLVGAIVLLGLAIISNNVSAKSVTEAAKKESAAQATLAHTARQRAAIVSMGIGERAIDRWRTQRHEALNESMQAVNANNFLTALSRSIRQILQIAILGMGAFLALQQQVSPGAIIAGSIIMGRGLAPIDQAVAIWRVLLQTLQSRRDLKDYLENSSSTIAYAEGNVTAMPRPAPALKLEEFSVAAPGADKALLPHFSVELSRGSIVALLGPSGAGKTSLLQTLAGAWGPHSGTARLGGRDIHTWQADDRGRFVGYLPQDVELLTGTVFENIARFTEADPDDVFEAARKAGCHEMILSLPHGYDTPIGERGSHLSAGQRQSIGLARAFFGSPAMLLLDEPTAHLDMNMVGNLMQQFAEIARTPKAERDCTYVIATHDLRLINAADQIMVIQNRQVALMPRDEYLKKVSDLNQRRQQTQQPPSQPDGPATPVQGKGDSQATGQDQTKKEAPKITYNLDSEEKE